MSTYTDRIRAAAQEIEQRLPDVHPVNGYAEGADADYASAALLAIDRAVDEIKSACREWEAVTAPLPPRPPHSYAVWGEKSLSIDFPTRRIGETQVIKGHMCEYTGEGPSGPMWRALYKIPPGLQGSES